MKLELSNLQIDPAGMKIADKARAFTNIEADIRVHIGDQILFDEPMVCVVGLQTQLNIGRLL